MAWVWAALLAALVPMCISGEHWVRPQSWVSLEPGHYPRHVCHYRQVLLNHTDGKFHVFGPGRLADHCRQVSRIWQFESHEEVDAIECEELYDVGHTFAIYFYGTGSNYYHLHYDMMFPLYKALHYDRGRQQGQGSHVLMPAVETRRLQELDWDTSAFADPTKYWYETVQIMAAGHDIQPLDRSFRDRSASLCFKELYVGTEQVKFDDADFVQSFVRFVKTQLMVDTDMWKREARPRAALISRSRRRAILNEKELVVAVQNFTDLDLLKFETMTIKQQIAVMSRYEVVLGMNGAGLMNSIYLPPHGVAVQLVPYEAKLNHQQYGILLKGRGPYLIWHNTHAQLNHATGSKHNPHTVVHVEEFVDLLKEALALAEKHRLMNKDEL